MQNINEIQLNTYLLLGAHCKDKTILDAGCGFGEGSRLLAELGAKKVVAVDLNVQVITTAKAHNNPKNVNFQVGNIEQIDSLLEDETFDIIISNLALEYLVDKKGFLQGIKKLLKPDGLCIISYSNTTANQTSSCLNEIKDILGEPTHILSSYPSVGLVSFINKQPTQKIMQCHHNIEVALDPQHALFVTAIYDPHHTIEPHAKLHVMNAPAWHKLLSHDALSEMKKDRLIFELKQRALLAQALLIEKELKFNDKPVHYTIKQWLKKKVTHYVK